MTDEKKTFITDEMRAELGVEKGRRVSPAVTSSDIRKWAIAVYWPEQPPRLFWDEEYAKATPYGGIIAPEDFNPFTWPAEGEAFEFLRELARKQVSPGNAEPGQRTMNGGNEDVYRNPIRPGDVITSVSKLAEMFEKQTKGGAMVFRTYEDRWTNQDGKLVCLRRMTLINY